VIDTLRALAERIDAEWKAAGYGPTDLPAIATRLLAETRPDRAWDLAALANWTLAQSPFPDACNPFGPLGPPAFTIWSNAHFYVNVYVYTTPEVVIHDHDFSGAFMNLSGITIHCTYQLAEPEVIDPSVQIGTLRLRGMEAISDGAVRAIEPGQGFIHQVWHVSQPTAVLVIRTPPLTPALRQFQYIRPSIATEVFRSDSLSVGFPERFRNTRKMAEALRTSSAGIAYVKELVQREQPWDAVWHVMENWRYLRLAGALEDVVAHGAKHQGAWFGGLLNAGTDIEVFSSVQWPRIVAARDRIVLALLFSYHSWPSIRRTLEQLLPGTDATDELVATLARLGDERAIPLTLDAAARDALTRALRSGDASVAGALRERPILKPLFG
jgi:hypothetical protein